MIMTFSSLRTESQSCCNVERIDRLFWAIWGNSSRTINFLYSPGNDDMAENAMPVSEGVEIVCGLHTGGEKAPLNASSCCWSPISLAV